jgi:hypothetical protein
MRLNQIPELDLWTFSWILLFSSKKFKNFEMKLMLREILNIGISPPNIGLCEIELFMNV